MWFVSCASCTLPASCIFSGRDWWPSVPAARQVSPAVLSSAFHVAALLSRYGCVLGQQPAGWLGRCNVSLLQLAV